MKELILQKELTLINQINQRMHDLPLLYFKDIGFKFQS